MTSSRLGSEARQKISFIEKMNEVIAVCSLPAQRFALLVLAVSSSTWRPDDVEEFLRTVLAMSQDELDAARDEFNSKLEAWNEANHLLVVTEARQVRT